MKDHARERDTAAWLAHEFDGGDGKTPFAIRPESPEGTALPWPKVQRRIAQLIKEDRFYTQVEQDNLDDVDPIAIREALAQRGIVDGHVVDPEKLDNDPLFSRSCGMWRPYPGRPLKQSSRNSLLPAIRVFLCQTRNMLRPVARSGSGLLMIQQSLLQCGGYCLSG